MDGDVLLRFFVALIFTLSLIGLLYWLVRRYAPSRLLTPVGGGGRLQVIEVRALDSRRRLVLVRRDAVEHLLLLGIQGDHVVESGIKPGDTGRSDSFRDKLDEQGRNSVVTRAGDKA
jgi:flagellar protein FliO/FliZ